MNQRNCKLRRGLTLTEVVVAATLVVSMIGLIAPLTVRIGRVWQSTRQYRLAFNELANQMELLTSLGVSRCDAALANLKPSASTAELLPDARLEGELIRDQDGTRLILSLDWDRGTNSVPLTLVGWLDTNPVELSIVPKISGIGFQPVDVKSQAGSLCHIEEPTVILRSMLTLPLVETAESKGEQP